MEIVRERPSSRTSLKPSEANVEEPRLIPLPASTAALSDRCNVCAQNLRLCIEVIRQAADRHRNLSEQLRIRALENRLDEHRIRFDIWRSDCAVAKGWLSVLDNVESHRTGLSELVNSSFVRLEDAFKTLLLDISQIVNCNSSSNTLDSFPNKR